MKLGLQMAAANTATTNLSKAFVFILVVFFDETDRKGIPPVGLGLNNQ